MKAQVTLEMMLLFVFTLIAIMLISRSILDVYQKTEEKNSAVRYRAILENDLVTFSIWCNADVNPPSSILSTHNNYQFNLENWFVVIKVLDAYGIPKEVGNFSVVTLGCHQYGKKTFV